MKYFSYKKHYAAWRPGGNKEPVHIHITDSRYNSYGKFWISSNQQNVILEENYAYGARDLDSFASMLSTYIPTIVNDWRQSTTSSGLPMHFIDEGGPVNKPYY